MGNLRRDPILFEQKTKTIGETHIDCTLFNVYKFHTSNYAKMYTHVDTPVVGSTLLRVRRLFLLELCRRPSCGLDPTELDSFMYS